MIRVVAEKATALKATTSPGLYMCHTASAYYASDFMIMMVILPTIKFNTIIFCNFLCMNRSVRSLSSM